MKTQIHHEGKTFSCDLSHPIDISLPITENPLAASAWHCPPPSIQAVVMGDWIGDVNKGGAVNFRNITFNPHGNGTHTECVGHISKEAISVNKVLNTFHFLCVLVSVEPDIQHADKVIYPRHLECAPGLKEKPQAIVIRTLPQDIGKKLCQYTETNPPYLHVSCNDFMNRHNLMHLLIDLPSVDREHDNGALQMHHAFWNYPASKDSMRTITELVYIPSEVPDGLYLLNLMTAAFENDAAPSRPILYALQEMP